MHSDHGLRGFFQLGGQHLPELDLRLADFTLAEATACGPFLVAHIYGDAVTRQHPMELVLSGGELV